MIITIDTETQGLDATRFIMGALCYENLKTETFFNKQEMYARILEIAEKEKKRGRKLTVYAHHAMYDYIAIGAHEDPANIIYCTSPLIVDRMELQAGKEPRDSIKWIDSCGLWRGSLESMGEALGEPKGTTPEWLTQQDYTPNFIELNTARQYMEQDTRILMKFILFLREQLKKEGVYAKFLITTPQIAMAYFQHYLKKKEKELSPTGNTGIWYHDIDTGTFWPTRHPEEIYEAYRGGRNETFNAGIYEHVTMVDINSLYPYIGSTMRFPDLHSETKIYMPLTNGYTKEELFSLIGISNCIVETPYAQQNIGYLPIRTTITNEDGICEETSIYPRTEARGERKTLVGTWTHLELQRAQELGYTIHTISWSIVWEEGPNPLTDYFSTMYSLRKKNKGTPLGDFYKLMMNSFIGKLAQHREKFTLQCVDIEELPRMQQQGWENIRLIGTDCLIKKTEGVEFKKSHCPIIPTLINAGARDMLFTYLNHFSREELLYCDTDSIIALTSGFTRNKDNFIYGDTLGTWKEEHIDVPCHIYDKKAYSIGTYEHHNIKLNRVPKKAITREAFENGTITYTDIQGITTHEKSLIGKPIQRIRTLTEKKETKDNTKVYVDDKTRLTDTQLDIIKRLQHIARKHPWEKQKPS